MNNKDFNTWNKEKRRLEVESSDALPFHRHDIWWCSIGLNIGDEQDGKNDLFERPVLVLRKFNRKIAWVLPMSTQIKDSNYYYPIEYQGRVFSVMLSQLRLVSVKRFRRFIRKMSPYHFRAIQDKIINIVNNI